MDELNPEVANLFAAKEARRRRLAALPFPEKIRMLMQLQRMAAPILRARGRDVRPWKAMDAKMDLEDFRAQCRRQLARPVSERVRFGFFRNPNPVRDANRNLAFDSMQEYRRFCERSYPAYFGYARPGPATPPA